MKTLTLPLKKKWFEMIKSGEKKEEYRELTPYWKKRLRNVEKIGAFTTIYSGFKIFDNLVFTLGYPKKDNSERRLTFTKPRICIASGKVQWGAETGKSYFVITWSTKK